MNSDRGPVRPPSLVEDDALLPLPHDDKRLGRLVRRQGRELPNGDRSDVPETVRIRATLRAVDGFADSRSTYVMSLL